MGEISTQIAQYFSAETVDVVDTIIQKQRHWADECNLWLARATTYVAQQQAIDAKLEITTLQLKTRANKAIENFKKVMQSFKPEDQVDFKKINNEIEEQIETMSAYKNLAKARQNLLLAIMTDGYKMLNGIGQAIRGDQEAIVYSITTSSNGEAIGLDNTTYTWTMTEQDFLDKAVMLVGQRLVLKSSFLMRSASKNILYDQLSNDSSFIENEGTNINYNETSNMIGTYIQWSSERQESYTRFKDKIRHSKYAKINEGDMLESFLRWEDTQGHSLLNAEKSVAEMKKHNIPFYAGGDIGLFQIKGTGASVTSLSTLITQINNLRKILTNDSSYRPKIKQKIKQQVESLGLDQKLAKAEEETTEKVIEKLMNMFS